MAKDPANERLRAIVVDDEPLARQALERMLSALPRVLVCGSADCLDTADALIRETRPHVVYLDIQLFGESGFDLLPRMDTDIPVVFVTAFDRYAVRAFEVNALDYLLKPVSQKRLAETIARLRGLKESPAPSPATESMDIHDIVLVNREKQRNWVPLDQVCLVEAKGDFSKIWTTEGLHGIVWKRMHEWEKILPPAFFVRIHRRWIVNLAHVESFESIPGGRLLVHLKGAPKAPHASRSYSPALRRLLQNRPS